MFRRYRQPCRCLWCEGWDEPDSLDELPVIRRVD